MKKLLTVLLWLMAYQFNYAQRCLNTVDESKLTQDQRKKFDAFNQQASKQGQSRLTNVSSGEPVFLIPIVVHIVDRNPNMVTDAQVASQIAILNQDFRRTNADANQTPALFQGVAADMRIQFYLACTDPAGNPTNGITRTVTDRDAFVDPQIEFMKSAANGGSDPWDVNRYLNLWVCNLGEVGLVGFAQFPWEFANAPAIDGVVIDLRAFGNTGTALFPLDGGRTATHEIGHWLGLIHIWGDESGCRVDDQVGDTPMQADRSPFGAFGQTENCRNHPFTDACNSTIMFQNYMDYSEDRCMNLFTIGQKNRARSVFASERSAFQKQDYFVTGDGELCVSANGTFSVSGPTINAINWTTSEHLSIVSGQGTGSVQVAGGSDGLGWVEATITGGPCGNTTITIRKPVIVGTGQIGGTYSYGTNTFPVTGSTGISVSNSANTIWFNLNNSWGTSATYNWSVNSGGNISHNLGASNGGYITLGGGVSARVICYINTPCGQTSIAFNCYNYSGFRMAAYPNPANTDLTVAAVKTDDGRSFDDQNTETNDAAEGQELQDADINVQLLNRDNQVVSEGKLKQGKIKFSVNKLPVGIYYLHMSFGDKKLKRQIVIQH